MSFAMETTDHSDCSHIPLPVLELERKIRGGFVVSPLERMEIPFRDSREVGARDASENFTHEGVKEDLRKKIQERRRSEGLEPLKVDFSQPVKYELTREDLYKFEKRRERNRISSRICRLKRDAHYQCLLKEKTELEKKRKTLQNTVDKLKKKKQVLNEVVRNMQHQKRCEDDDDLEID